MLGGPFLAGLGIGKEMDVVAEAADDVRIEGAAGLEEGHNG